MSRLRGHCKPSKDGSECKGLNFAYNTIEIRANVNDRLETRIGSSILKYMRDANSIEKHRSGRSTASGSGHPFILISAYYLSLGRDK